MYSVDQMVKNKKEIKAENTSPRGASYPIGTKFIIVDKDNDLYQIRKHDSSVLVDGWWQEEYFIEEMATLF